MFPNTRLMIVAIFASIAVLICGFGIFAALRVNHEPLSRLPAGGAPPGFVADRAAPTAGRPAVAEPFGSRFQSSEAAIAAAAAGLSPPNPDRRGEAEPPAAVSTIAPVPAPAADDVAQPASAPETLPVAAANAAAPAQEQQAVEPGRNATAEPAADFTGTVSRATPSDSAAGDRPADQAPPMEQTTVKTQVTPKVTAKTGRKAVSARRLAASARRAARSRARRLAQPTNQTSPLQQLGIQSAPNAAPLPAQRQVLLKPRRSTKKPAAHRAAAPKAAAKKTAVGGPLVNRLAP